MNKLLFYCSLIEFLPVFVLFIIERVFVFKKTLILACLSMIGMNLSAAALPESKSVSSKNSGTPAVLYTKPSRAELQKCVKEARAYIADLRKMGYSTQEISGIVAEQIGVTAGLSQDFYEGHVTTKKMWTLLISAVVVSSVVGIVGASAGLVGDMFVRRNLARQRYYTAYYH